MLSDRLPFTHILVDEIHERSSQCDMLFIMLKSLLEKQTSTKLILMSATAEVGKFVRHFPGAAPINGMLPLFWIFNA